MLLAAPPHPAIVDTGQWVPGCGRLPHCFGRVVGEYTPRVSTAHTLGWGATGVWQSGLTACVR